MTTRSDSWTRIADGNLQRVVLAAEEVLERARAAAQAPRDPWSYMKLNRLSSSMAALNADWKLLATAVERLRNHV